jgi:hypothetical protein
MLRRTLAIRYWAILAAGLGGPMLVPGSALAAAFVITGSPTYSSSSSTGFQNGGVYVPGTPVNNSGIAVAYSDKYVAGAPKGERAVRWDSTGTAAVELGNLGTNASGVSHTSALAINDAGTAVGYSDKYDSGVFVGTRAVLWNVAGTAAIELANLGLDAGGATNGEADAINAAGLIVGYSDKYDSGTYKGTRAVRWDATGAVATELGVLGTDVNGITNAGALAINDAGVAVGSADKYVGVNNRGRRAVRWDLAGTATELGNLGTDSSGSTFATAYAINNAGTAVGYAHKYVGTSFVGARAVRWDSSGTAATELGNLGTDVVGAAAAVAYAVNTAGTAVGYSAKYESTTFKGLRGVRWDSTGTAATELANLGTDPNNPGMTNAQAYSVNDAGTAVGYAWKYFDFGGGNFQPLSRAVIWLPDSSVLDINDLSGVGLPNDGFWQLRSASSISDDGWVAGSAQFIPFVGSAYIRNFVTQIGLGGTWTSAITATLDGTWGRGRQWSTGTPAMLVGNATFSASSTYTVSLDRNEATQNVTVSGGNVTFNLNTFTLTSPVVISGGTLNVVAAGVPTIVGNVSNVGGTFGNGTPVGNRHVAGTFSQSTNGKLHIDLASASSYDKLLIDGSAALGGTLEVSLLGGYSPLLGAQFDILDPASTSGTFSSYLLPPIDPSLQWNTSNLATTGVLSITIAGNFNGDGAVNAADYVTWRKGVGTTYTQNDYARWRENFGALAPSNSPGLGLSLAAAAVPEPASFALVGSALAMLWARRRRHRTPYPFGRRWPCRAAG